MPIKTKEPLCRISVSLRESVHEALDVLVESRGFENRSQAISEMIHKSVMEYNQEQVNKVMAGTITLFYDETATGIRTELANIQRENIKEVISSQHVLLEDNYTMEVIVVQGPANKLKELSDKFVTCKGVKSGNLTLTSAILPPLHDH